MGILTKIFGLKTSPAKVEVVRAPAKVSRQRMQERLNRVEDSIARLSDRKKSPEKVARLQAEATYLREELGI